MLLPLFDAFSCLRHDAFAMPPRRRLLRHCHAAIRRFRRHSYVIAASALHVFRCLILLLIHAVADAITMPRR